MKTVLVVGAGPAGLVAAKSLLQHNDGETFAITVFEAADRVGGMWRSRPGEFGDKCSPDMRTNLSRFTVTFPDLAWQSVAMPKLNPLSSVAATAPPKPAPPPFLGTGLPHVEYPTPLPQYAPLIVENEQPRGHKSFYRSTTKPSERVAEPNPPLFPKAWEVGQYLQAYADKFVGSSAIQLKRRVKTAHAVANEQWIVISEDTSTMEEFTDTFDFLIVASGFFGKPVSGIKPAETATKISTAHSSEFRAVTDLGGKPGKLVVVGGGISGTEAAATAAFQISNAQHSPGPKPKWTETIVYHVFDRPFYTLPRLLPLKFFDPSEQKEFQFHRAPLFLPLDLVLYRLEHKPKGQISAFNGLASPEKSVKGHGHISLLTGTTVQSSSIFAQHIPREDEKQYPPFVSISDTYVEFVRSGLIVPIRGRVEDVVHDSESRKYSVTTASKGDWAFNKQQSTKRIEDVVGIVEATGFQTSIDYLSDAVKQALDWDPGCRRVPFLLSRGSMFSPNISNIAFVGFYEGPFWGVMDIQSRVIAHAWGTGLQPDVQKALYDVSESTAVREAIRSKNPDVPQFWMADHAGLVEELSRIIGVQRDDSAFGGQKGPYLSARYQGRCANDDTSKIILEVANLFNDPEQLDTATKMYAECVSGAVFGGIQGSWKIERTMSYKARSAPYTEEGHEWTLEGKFIGTAEMHPRVATVPGPCDSAEYLYKEQGTWSEVDGDEYTGSGSCIWNLNREVLTIWSADTNGRPGPLLQKPTFRTMASPYRGWQARFTQSNENCDFWTYYEFWCEGAKIPAWRIRHEATIKETVFRTETMYQRPVTSAGDDQGHA